MDPKQRLIALLNGSPWQETLSGALASPEFHTLAHFVDAERASGDVFPAEADTFRAFMLTPPAKVKVVLLGQDPYHGPGQAHGLCFSVPQGVPAPPSLRNILKELAADTGTHTQGLTNLTNWGQQGVLLLNAVLTVRSAEPASHAGHGWESVTDAAIRALNLSQNTIVFLLLGGHAQKKSELIDATRHTILAAPHPSPLSAHRGFFGSKIFTRVNAALMATGQDPIDWTLVPE
jgi:uracil-DNA glycosylase